MPSLYKTWDEYMDAFWQVGGVIEAAPSWNPAHVVSPSVSFFVAPDGEIDLIGSFDRFQAKEYINAGWFFPQTSLPNMNLMTLCKSIGDILYEKGVIGHVTVDLVAFPDPTNPKAHPLFWAVDINCNLSDYAAACFHFDLLMEGRIDKYTGQYFVEVQRDPDELVDADLVNEAKDKANKNEFFEPRNFMFCKYLHHPGLATIQFNTFFHMCRLESVSYDMEKRTGSTFWLYDCLQGGVIGLITVGEHRKVTVNYMVDALNFIQNQAGVIPSKALNEETAKMDELNVGDVFSRVISLVSYFKKHGQKSYQSFFRNL